MPKSVLYSSFLQINPKSDICEPRNRMILHIKWTPTKKKTQPQTTNTNNFLEFSSVLKRAEHTSFTQNLQMD